MKITIAERLIEPICIPFSVRNPVDPGTITRFRARLDEDGYTVRQPVGEYVTMKSWPRNEWFERSFPLISEVAETYRTLDALKMSDDVTVRR